MNYVSSKAARNHFNVTAATIRNWVNMGRMKAKKISNRKFLYDIDSYDPDKADLVTEPIDERKSVIYARVSNTKQINDLNDQIETIKKFCLCKGVQPDIIYKDIASGMNEQRKEFNQLIDDVVSGRVKEIYISFRDRLTRFGYDYFVNLFKKFNTEIIVLDDKEETSKTFQQEMTEDLVSIIHHFSMKLYSNKIKKLKEINKILQEEE